MIRVIWSGKAKDVVRDIEKVSAGVLIVDIMKSIGAKTIITKVSNGDSQTIMQ